MAQLIPESEVNLEALQAASIDRPPIITGAPLPISGADPYQIGTLPVQLGLQSDLPSTQLRGGPIFRLMPPPPAGQASNNSSNDSSLLKNPTFQQVQTTTNITAIAVAAQALTGWQGSWITSVNYSLGAITEEGGTVYVSLQNQNLGNDPSSSPTFWQATGADVFLGAWNSGTAYVIGDIVSVASALYIAVANSTNQNPTSTSGFWAILTANSVYEGTWSSLTAYSVGQTVSYQGAFYICVVANTNVAPAPTGSTDWTLLGTSNTLIGNWSSSVAYVANNQVVFTDGNIYQCILANTNQTPPNATYWQLTGPDTLQALADGPSRFAATGATLTYKPESNMLTAVDAGSNATIDVASWVNQVQGDAISYNSGSITALSYNTLYFVLMQDPTLAGGSPSGGYQATTNKYNAIAGSGNFFLGSIVTPSNGGANTNGFGDGGAGAQFGIAYIAGPGAQNYVGNAGSPATFTNQSFSMMGGPNNFATLSYTVPSTAARTNTYALSNFALPQSNYTSLVLNIPTALPTNSATGTSAVWQVFYSLDGGISFTNVIDIIAGTTYAFTNTTVSLSATQNPAAIQVRYILATGTNTTSGTITGDIYTPYITGAN